MTREPGIIIYIFKADGGLSREGRIQRSAEHYCGLEEDFVSSRISGGEAFDKQQAGGLFRMEKTPLGKPFFANLPKVHLSISHSGDYWVCALAPDEVGVDIQEHVMNRNETRQEATVRFSKMARRFFHPVEAKYVEEESFYRFFGVWAARESYVKYTGQGIDASFSEHCVIPEAEEMWPELTPSLRYTLMQKPAAAQVGKVARWHAQGSWFWETVFVENYTLCVCAGEEMPCRVISCF